MYRRVILPTDGSEESMKGVEEGMKLASFLEVPVTAIHVVELGELHISEKMEKALRRSGEKILDEVGSLANEMDVEIEKKIFNGTPYKRISEYAEEDDVIYISSHGSSGFKDIFLGSTTDRLLKHAKCTVATVKGTPGEIKKSQS